MYPVSVSIFTDQWLIGPTNQLQISVGNQILESTRVSAYVIKCHDKVLVSGQAGESMGLFGGSDICRPMDNMVGVFKQIISSHLLSHLLLTHTQYKSSVKIDRNFSSLRENASLTLKG